MQSIQLNERSYSNSTEQSATSPEQKERSLGNQNIKKKNELLSLTAKMAIIKEKKIFFCIS